MASLDNINCEMHAATGAATLDTLKLQADAFCSGNPTLLQIFINGVYREYNRKKFYYYNGSGMLTPYDAGLRPTGYSV